MLSIVKILILFVQTIVGQMRVDIVDVGLLVRLRRQSDQPIIKQKDRRLINHRKQQNVNPKVKLVPVPQRRMLDVLLNNIRGVLVVVLWHLSQRI